MRLFKREVPLYLRSFIALLGLYTPFDVDVLEEDFTRYGVRNIAVKRCCLDAAGSAQLLRYY